PNSCPPPPPRPPAASARSAMEAPAAGAAAVDSYWVTAEQAAPAGRAAMMVAPVASGAMAS
ncbi:hypothetical protein OSI59_24530, partial [Mycobacterium ulcerans]